MATALEEKDESSVRCRRSSGCSSSDQSPYLRTIGKVGTTSGSEIQPAEQRRENQRKLDGCRVGPCGSAGGGEDVYWCGPLWLWEELAPWRGEGGWVWARGRGSAPQQRRAWNTDSLLLPGQMSPTRL